MDFQERLEKAIERGARTAQARAEAAAVQQLNEEECKRLYSQYRLELSDHIEKAVAQLPNHFPGFRYETLVGDRGWGAAIRRDDLVMHAGKRNNEYSRLEMVVRPYSAYHVLDLSAKGTIRNKEVYSRSHFQGLGQVDLQSFKELCDLWLLEYAELYAAKS